MAEAHHGHGLEAADDRIVAGRAADGDTEAFRVLVLRYGPVMRGYARRMLNGGEDVDDVVQDALVSAWQRLPDLEKPEAVRSWLLRIVTHKALERIRARRPHADITEMEQAAPESASPPRVAERRSQLEELAAALAELPEAQRQCWVLREFAGYSYEELADELGLPLSTVRGLLARARKYLIVRMEAWR
jgi:RNA polymerase sigma-70 factor (ECF subfamily)